MYKQENKAGFKDFLKVLAMAVAAVIISELFSMIVAAVTGGAGAALAGQILLIVMCVIIVFFVYNHYASVYNYKITKKHIVIEKKTGRRVTEYEIPLVEINKMYIRKNPPKLEGKKLRLCSSIFGYKKTTVITCGEENNVIIFEPDDKFVKKIKEYMND